MKKFGQKEGATDAHNVEYNSINTHSMAVDINSNSANISKSQEVTDTMQRVSEISPEEWIQAKITKKLIDLKLKVKAEHVVIGPVVTTYYFKTWSPIASILSKGEDIALATESEKVIVQRDEGHIIISIPNKERKSVDFKENLYWYLHDEEVDKQIIPIPIGMDIVGRKSSLDLTEMPHILIAGSTGAGKSVFLANIISSLGYKFSSDKLHLYLVDTKRVDLTLFKQLPHVIALADDIKSFHNEVCYQVMGEIRKRLGEFQKLSVQNIAQYHARGLEMPFIIVIIDELADVISLDKELDRRKDGAYEGVPTLEAWLKQVTSIARAAGIHIIACTQRSSVKVVNGEIKANLPCRIALRLPTGVDSRTILGQNGAENLLGKGDMLIQRPEKDIVERYHGPYVKMEDINELITNYAQMRSILNG